MKVLDLACSKGAMLGTELLRAYHLRRDETVLVLHAGTGGAQRIVGFQISVRMLNGNAISIRTHSCDTVLGIKEKIMHCEGIPPDQQRIIYAGWQLEDARTTFDYNIHDQAILQLMLKLT